MKSVWHRLFFLLAVLTLVCGCADKPVLERITTYKAPPLPAGSKVKTENYEYRLSLGIKNPPTLVDTLVCDLWRRMDEDLKLKGVFANQVTPRDVREAIDFYVARNYEGIVGYRSWTHSNFLKGLSRSDRAKLAKEVANYMKKYSVREAQP
jgi:hypothetical protein